MGGGGIRKVRIVVNRGKTENKEMEGRRKQIKKRTDEGCARECTLNIESCVFPILLIMDLKTSCPGSESEFAAVQFFVKRRKSFYLFYILHFTRRHRREYAAFVRRHEEKATEGYRGNVRFVAFLDIS